VLAPRKLRNISKKNARSQAVYQHLQYLDANTLLKNNCADASSRRYASDKKRYMLRWIPKAGLLEPIRRATTSSPYP
jgi:hypothetical protein